MCSYLSKVEKKIFDPFAEFIKYERKIRLEDDQANRASISAQIFTEKLTAIDQPPLYCRYNQCNQLHLSHAFEKLKMKYLTHYGCFLINSFILNPFFHECVST